MMPSHIEADGLCSYTAMTVGLLGSQSFVVRQKMQLVEASHCHMDFFCRFGALYTNEGSVLSTGFSLKLPVGLNKEVSFVTDF